MEDDVVRFDLTGTSPYRWTEAFIFYGNNPDRRCWCTQVRNRLAYAMLGKIYPQRIKLCYQTPPPPPLLYTNFVLFSGQSKRLASAPATYLQKRGTISTPSLP